MRDVKIHPDAKDPQAQIMSYGGIYTAYVSVWADELDCAEEEVVRALDARGQIIMDTARQKGQTDYDRPQAADKRCIAVIPQNGLLTDHD